MTVLLTYREDQSPDQGLTGTILGGRPSAPAGELTWPDCRTCASPMTYLGRLHDEDADHMYLLFACEADPGLCAEWEPFSGGNAVVVVGAEQLDHAPVPEADRPLVSEDRWELDEVEREEASYDEARHAWAEEEESAPTNVAGLWGGDPDWIQGEETPDCPDCGEPMRFVAMLEEGRPGFTFGGGGCAYVFSCADDDRAAMLYQS